MSEPVKVRRLTDYEGRRLQRLVRRGEGQGKASVVRYRRALVILASAGGNTVPVIAKLVHTSPDRVREVIHNFDVPGPQVGGWPSFVANTWNARNCLARPSVRNSKSALPEEANLGILLVVDGAGVGQIGPPCGIDGHRLEVEQLPIAGAAGPLGAYRAGLDRDGIHRGER